MTPVTDEYMRTMLPQAKRYSVVILKAGPKRNEAGAETLIWEHARRNFELRAEGVLPIVCPIRDGGTIAGIGIFDAPVETVKTIVDEDPGVKAGIFAYEIHPCDAFPGDCLP